MNEQLETLLKETKENLKGNSSMHEGLKSFANLINCFYNYLEEKMDKQIKKIQKKEKGALKETKKLMKMDKKRDKECKMGEKMMHKK